MSTEPEQTPPGDTGRNETVRAETGRDETGRDETVDVQIRRAPKLVVFLLMGAALGVLAALIFTSIFEVDPAVGFTGTFAYIALYAIPLAVALAAIIGLLLDRASKRRASIVSARHEVLEFDDAADSDVANTDATESDAADSDVDETRT